MEVLLVLLGLAIGGAVGWFWARSATRARMQKTTGELTAQLKSAEATQDALKAQMDRAEKTLAETRVALAEQTSRRTVAETRLEEARKSIDEQKILLKQATDQLKESFDALSANALKSNNQAFLELAKSALEKTLSDAKGDLGKRQEAIGALVKPLSESLGKFDTRIQELERAREKAYGGLQEQLESLSRSSQDLQKETTALVSALKRPHVKGRWGEITLKRAVEVAGMSEYCDFVEQESVDTDEGRRRPDMVVSLPGDRTIVVDAKTPLTAYVEAYETSDEAIRKQKLDAHSKAVRGHMKDLSSKAYWAQFKQSPDLVVMFLPGESFFSAALEQDRGLMEDSFKAKVLIATPATLIALLRSVAQSWQQQQVAENAQKIWDAGVELYERISKFAEHLNAVKSGLDKATRSFNQAVGSWDSRVLPSARRLKELGTVQQDKALPSVEPTDAALREPLGSEIVQED